jgi:predicted amidohydrolase YtcJ
MRTLFRASKVHTLSYPATGEWILVDGRHVQRVGVGEPPGADRVVDLPGATIVPGFIDSHVHLTGTGVHHRTPEVARAASSVELAQTLRAVAADHEGPVLVHGFDESTWRVRTPPSIGELDAASERPLAVVRVDGHVTLANHRALEESAVSGPGLELDVDGHPTGRVTQGANARLKRWFNTHLSEHDVEQLQLAAASLAVSHGVTSIHEMSMLHERGVRDLEILLAHRSRLPLDVVTYVATTDIPQVMDLGLSSIGGDLPLDGSIGARTASLTSAYADAPGLGASAFSDDELAEFFHGGHLASLQVGVHAIGDAAVEQVVRTWERVYGSLDSRERRHFRARRHRVEHFEMASADILERAAMLGLGISVQPTFDAVWGSPGGLYEQALGWDRAAAMNPFRGMLDRGIEMGAGSDSPITTLDPMVGIAAFGAHHDPGQRLTREEAIRVFTLGSARLAHQEDKKGSLAPGKHADLVAYDVDPFDTEEPVGARPILTVSLGRDVFAA